MTLIWVNCKHKEWKAIAAEAINVAHRSHPASPLPVLEPNPSKGERTHAARGKGAGAKRNLANEVDDDIFAHISYKVVASVQQIALDHIRQGLSATAKKGTQISKISIGQLTGEGEEGMIRQWTRNICSNIFPDNDKDIVALEALCDTFGIKTTANTASGIIQVLLRVCRRTSTPLSRIALQFP